MATVGVSALTDVAVVLDGDADAARAGLLGGRLPLRRLLQLGVAPQEAGAHGAADDRAGQDLQPGWCLLV